MRRLFAKSMWRAFLSFLIAISCCPAFAAENRTDRNALLGLPVLLYVEMYQLGANEVIVGLKGKDLPEPELFFEGNQIRIFFKEGYIRRFSDDFSKFSAADDQREMVPDPDEKRVQQLRIKQDRNQESSAPVKREFQSAALLVRRLLVGRFAFVRSIPLRSVSVRRRNGPAQPGHEPIRITTSANRQQQAADRRKPPDRFRFRK